METVSIKSLYNFKHLLQRQATRQTSEDSYKILRIFYSFFLCFPYSCLIHVRPDSDFNVPDMWMSVSGHIVGTLVALRGHSVHKVSLQFQTFIAKARDKTDK